MIAEAAKRYLTAPSMPTTRRSRCGAASRSASSPIEWWAIAESTRLNELRAVCPRAACGGADRDRPPPAGDPGPREPRGRAAAPRAARGPADAGASRHRSPGRGACAGPGVSSAVWPTRPDSSRHRRSARSNVRSPAVPMTSPMSSVGRPLRGYVIHEAIGEGSFGRVYAATQPGTRAAGRGQGDPTRPRRLVRLRPPLRGRGPARRPPRAPAHRPAVRLLARAGRRLSRVPAARPVARHSTRWSPAAPGRWPGSAGSSRRSAARSSPRTPPVSRTTTSRRRTCCSTTTAAPTSPTSASRSPGDEPAGRRRATSRLRLVAVGAAHRCRAADARRRSNEPPGLVGRRADAPAGLDAVLAKATAAEGGYASVAELVLAWRLAVGRPDRSRLARRVR